ncbi:hypothetical protein M0812_20610 [Anaeramoeba flamelloides]|uniref:Uncharacterized protein n=1 Tax=Anaeramoeba flamelloides TaxID=1746091 RepID=A0AAV7YWA6_9EUKA|nr:hypothetical protein M0812_20610 [Anaeramoeba flamelloides]
MEKCCSCESNQTINCFKSLFIQTQRKDKKTQYNLVPIKSVWVCRNCIQKYNQPTYFNQGESVKSSFQILFLSKKNKKKFKEILLSAKNLTRTKSSFNSGVRSNEYLSGLTNPNNSDVSFLGTNETTSNSEKEDLHKLSSVNMSFPKSTKPNELTSKLIPNDKNLKLENFLDSSTGIGYHSDKDHENNQIFNFFQFPNNYGIKIEAKNDERQNKNLKENRKNYQRSSLVMDQDSSKRTKATFSILNVNKNNIPVRKRNLLQNVGGNQPKKKKLINIISPKKNLQDQIKIKRKKISSQTKKKKIKLIPTKNQKFSNTKKGNTNNNKGMNTNKSKNMDMNKNKNKNKMNKNNNIIKNNHIINIGNNTHNNNIDIDIDINEQPIISNVPKNDTQSISIENQTKEIFLSKIQKRKEKKIENLELILTNFVTPNLKNRFINYDQYTDYQTYLSSHLDQNSYYLELLQDLDIRRAGSFCNSLSEMYKLNKSTHDKLIKISKKCNSDFDLFLTNLSFRLEMIGNESKNSRHINNLEYLNNKERVAKSIDLKSKGITAKSNFSNNPNTDNENNSNDWSSKNDNKSNNWSQNNWNFGDEKKRPSNSQSSFNKNQNNNWSSNNDKHPNYHENSNDWSSNDHNNSNHWSSKDENNPNHWSSKNEWKKATNTKSSFNKNQKNNPNSNYNRKSNYNKNPNDWDTESEWKKATNTKHSFDKNQNNDWGSNNDNKSNNWSKDNWNVEVGEKTKTSNLKPSFNNNQNNNWISNNNNNVNDHNNPNGWNFVSGWKKATNTKYSFDKNQNNDWGSKNDNKSNNWSQDKWGSEVDEKTKPSNLSSSFNKNQNNNWSSNNNNNTNDHNNPNDRNFVNEWKRATNTQPAFDKNQNNDWGSKNENKSNNWSQDNWGSEEDEKAKPSNIPSSFNKNQNTNWSSNNNNNNTNENDYKINNDHSRNNFINKNYYYEPKRPDLSNNLKNKPFQSKFASYHKKKSSYFPKRINNFQKNTNHENPYFYSYRSGKGNFPHRGNDSQKWVGNTKVGYK